MFLYLLAFLLTAFILSCVFNCIMQCILRPRIEQERRMRRPIYRPAAVATYMPTTLARQCTHLIARHLIPSYELLPLPKALKLNIKYALEEHASSSTDRIFVRRFP
jgi:hypothetical protein